VLSIPGNLRFASASRAQVLNIPAESGNWMSVTPSSKCLIFKHACLA
jgi:hypothetical protein